MSVPDKIDAASRVAVIIVNYGTADLAIQAVESVLTRDHGAYVAEVHLVDNASPAGDAEVLAQAHAARDWGDRVTFWPEATNHGFGRGNNVVLQALAKRDDPPGKVFLLNPDARLDNGAIEMLATALDTTPGAAAAGAGVLRPDQTQVTAAFRFPGAASELARMINISLLNRAVRHKLVALHPYYPATAVDWVSGACVMFRFDALRAVDFFDPGFFLYFEEVDLMRRLRDAGWSILYEPQAHVVHEEGAATGQFGKFTKRRPNPPYLYQSWRHYFSRAFGRWKALAIALMMVPAACVNILHRRIRGQTPTLPLDFIADHWRHVIRPLVFGARDT